MIERYYVDVEIYNPFIGFESYSSGQRAILVIAKFKDMFDKSSVEIFELGYIEQNEYLKEEDMIERADALLSNLILEFSEVKRKEGFSVAIEKVRKIYNVKWRDVK